MTNLDIVSMVQDKLSVTLIKAKIQSNPASFDTSNNAISQLKKLGVSEAVIVAMIEKMAADPTTASATTAPTGTQSTSGTNAVAAGNASQSLASLPAKRKGVPRIGIVTTTTTAPLEQDEAVRAQFYEVLYGNRETSTTEAVLMREKLDRNISSEAKLTKCDYILYVSLSSTIESASQTRGNFLQKSLKATAEALGAVSKLSPIGALGLTYKGYMMTDSLQASNSLLSMVAENTQKNDKIGINFRLVRVASNEEIFAPSVRDIVAKKKKEPILQNLLIQLGNEVVNAIPAK